MALDQAQVARLFGFIKRNRPWNREFQKKEYHRALAHCDSPLSRLTHLLHTIANTQSRPKLQLLGPLWRELATFAPTKAPSILEFTEHLERKQGLRQEGTRTWDRLFNALTAQTGLGAKTSALFVKSAIEIHRGPEPLHFFLDSKPAFLPQEDDVLYLPVDSVITHIFVLLGLKGANFHTVNAALHKDYTAEQMLVWDDLWYWGFFTQVSKDKKRVLGWNQDKFWCQVAAPTDREAKVKRLGEQFIRLCEDRPAAE